MNHRNKSIQTKLLFSFLIFSISLSILVLSCAYMISGKYVKQRMKEATALTVDSVAASIDSEFKKLKQLCDYLYVNSAIKEAVMNGDAISKNYFSLRTNAYQAIDSYIFSYTGDNLNNITILGKNGYSLIYAINRTDIYIDANLPFSYDSIVEEVDFSKQQAYLGGILKDRFYPSEKITLTHIPLYRILKSPNYSEDIGVICLSINPRLFYNALEQYELSAYGQQCSIVVLDNQNEMLNPDVCDLDRNEIDRILNSERDSDGFLETRGSGHTYYIKPISDGWHLLCIIPHPALLKDNPFVTTLSLICIPLCILLCSLLHYYVMRHIFQPIHTYGKTLKLIASGQSELRIQPAARDEIGTLGEDINHMLDKIEQLNQENLNIQLNLHDAFYQERLTQINPHFLYNTLDSIRWMAMMSNNMHIKQAIESLWKISRYNMDSKNIYFVSLKEEIDIVTEYIYLQKLRYANKFTVDWNYSQDILGCPCPKLFLQPIVENAIIHGAYPKADTTSIIIDFYLEDDFLIFHIFDDGCGMSEDVRQQLLDFQKGVFSSGSGFKNVLERLYYLYQGNFTLDIQSKLQEFTSILIKLPLSSEHFISHQKKEEP